MIADIEGDFKELMEVETPDELPILPVRNLVLFPGVVTPILIGRESSLALVKRAEKKNLLIEPFRWMARKVKGWFEEKDDVPRGNGATDINPFRMNKKDYMLMKTVLSNIGCAVDKKTSGLYLIRKEGHDFFILSETFIDYRFAWSCRFYR